ncbi:MAG TPA: GNAT family N-acetyltransferase, partial [Chitinophagaceae bacterium]|nr:GNAT family N-acetyltransferase [Chitinophagaceae bacterium]
MDERTQEYSIERLSADNLPDLSILYTEVYNRKPGAAYFQKKYDTGYTGLKYTGYFAYDKEHRPLAYYGVIPCFVGYTEKIMLAAQSADTMTSPRHRYKGLFVELSNKTFALCQGSGIKLVFGFPNQNSYHGAVNKLGWKMTHELDCFTIPVKRNVMGKLLTGSRGLRKIYQSYSGSVLKKFLMPGDGFKSSVIADGFAGVC